MWDSGGLIYSDRKQVRGYLQVSMGIECKGVHCREPLGLVLAFHILTVVVITWMYTLIKTYWTLHLKCAYFIYKPCLKVDLKQNERIVKDHQIFVEDPQHERKKTEKNRT